MGRLLALAGAALLAGCGTLAPAADATLVIAGATVLDGRGGPPLENATVVVAAERIVYVGAADSAPSAPNARVIDGAGKWVIPGLIDVHVHDASADSLRRLLDWGVTSAFVMPIRPLEDAKRLVEASWEPTRPEPRMRTSEMFVGTFPEHVVPVEFHFLKPRTPDTARVAVRQSRARGHASIKIIQDDSVLWSGEELRSVLLPQPVVLALVEEARAQDMRVYAHSTSAEASRALLAAGVDALIHGTMDVELGAEDWARMVDAGTVYAPTYHALLHYGDQVPYARRLLADARFTESLPQEERARWKILAETDVPIVLETLHPVVDNLEAYLLTSGRNTRAAEQAGVTLATGSDGGPSGISTHMELALMQELGLTPTEVLTAATRGGALALGCEDEVGTIEVGKLADLVVLDADPTVDIRNCREIAWVIKGGTNYR